MDSRARPTIRMELDHLRHTIVQHMGVAGSELDEHLKSAVERAFDNLDLKDYVVDVVNEEIKNAIDSFFKYGDGRKFIDAAIVEGIGEMIKKGLFNQAR